jgi:hypothetical protein
VRDQYKVQRLLLQSDVEGKEAEENARNVISSVILFSMLLPGACDQLGRNSGHEPNDVIEDGDHHQCHQDAHSRTLGHFSEPLGKSPPGQKFQRIIQ